MKISDNLAAVICITLFCVANHCANGNEDMCTGNFMERDLSDAWNKKQRPPAGTKCAEPCVFESGRWGSSWCRTGTDGDDQWGAECVLCGAVLDDTSVTATPEIYIAVEKFTKKGPMRDYLYDNQIQQEAQVKDGVIYERRHPADSGKAEKGFAELLQETFKLYDTRFSEGVSAYWTVAIRIARRNSGSKWHSYAKRLPVGVQTIKVKTPKHWFTERVRSWLDVKEKKVLVY